MFICCSQLTTESAETAPQEEPAVNRIDEAKPEEIPNGSVESNGSLTKRKKHMKRREDQFVSQTLKGLADVEDPEEKLRALARKLFQSNEESKQSQVSYPFHSKDVLP